MNEYIFLYKVSKSYDNPSESYYHISIVVSKPEDQFHFSDLHYRINSVMVARLILNLKAVATFEEDEHDPDVISSGRSSDQN